MRTVSNMSEYFLIYKIVSYIYEYFLIYTNIALYIQENIQTFKGIGKLLVLLPTLRCVGMRSSSYIHYFMVIL